MKDIIFKIAKLIDVKSIVTLLMTLGYIVLTFLGKMTSEYHNLYLIIISFYFGTQIEKLRSDNK